MAFDPKKKYAADGLPAGIYLLAMVDFKRKDSNGKPYRSCRYMVISGPMKKRSFFAYSSMDESSGGAMAALARYCGAIDQQESFDLQDDKAFGDVFLGQPFKAKVKLETKGNYTNNDIEKFEDMTVAEKDACDAWWDDWCSRSQQRAEQSESASDFNYGENAKGKDDWD